MEKKTINYEFENYRLTVKEDFSEFTLFCSGRIVNLTPPEVKVLFELIKNRGVKVTKKELLKFFTPKNDERDVEGTVYRLRTKLQDYKGERFIKTRRHGYSFEGAVRESFETDPPPAETAEDAEAPDFQYAAAAVGAVDANSGEKMSGFMNASESFHPRQVRRLIGYASFAAVVALITVAAVTYFNAKDGDFTLITVDEAKVHLDLSREQGAHAWRELSDADRQKDVPLSTAVLNFDYKIRKHFETVYFTQRIGTFSNNKPELVNPAGYPVVEKDVLKDSQKCSPGIKFSKLFYFDISDKRVGVPFELSFQVRFFNAHNRQKKENHSYFVHRPVDRLEFKISFPKSKNFPKQIRLYRLNSCNDPSPEEMPKNTREQNFANYVVENPIDGTVTWYVESPLVNKIYRIEWDWQ